MRYQYWTLSCFFLNKFPYEPGCRAVVNIYREDCQPKRKCVSLLLTTTRGFLLPAVRLLKLTTDYKWIQARYQTFWMLVAACKQSYQYLNSLSVETVVQWSKAMSLSVSRCCSRHVYLIPAKNISFFYSYYIIYSRSFLQSITLEQPHCSWSLQGKYRKKSSLSGLRWQRTEGMWHK